MWSYKVENDEGGHPRWLLYNGSEVAAYSGESFATHGNAVAAAQNFKAHAAAWAYTTFLATNGQYYWHARASNNKNVAASGRGYPTQAAADASSASVRLMGGTAVGP